MAENPLGRQWTTGQSKFGDPTLLDPSAQGWDSARAQAAQHADSRQRGGWGNPAHVQAYLGIEPHPPMNYYRTGRPGEAQRALPGMEMSPQQHVDALVEHLNSGYRARQRDEGHRLGWFRPAPSGTYPMVRSGRFAFHGRDAGIDLQMEHHPDSPFHSDQWDTGDPEEDSYHRASHGPRQEPPQAVLDWQGHSESAPEYAHANPRKPHLQGEIKIAAIGGLHGEGGDAAQAWHGHGVMSKMFDTARRIAAEHPEVAEPRHSPTRTEEGYGWSQAQMRRHGEEVW